MSRDNDQDEPWVVADLRPTSFEAVALRLLGSKTFEELVYRESEMDALFTMADIAVKEEERARAQAGSGMTPSPKEEQLRALRALVFEAHDLSHDDRVVEAAAVLREAAKIADNEEGEWRSKT